MPLFRDFGFGTQRAFGAAPISCASSSYRSPTVTSTSLLSLLTLGITLVWSSVVSGQEQIRFGTPVRANSALPSSQLLSLTTAQPRRELATAAEVLVVSGYEPSGGAAGTTVQVNVDRPGSRVLLVLTAYEKINWQVAASPATTISGILVSGHYPPTVTTTVQTQGYLSRLPYACETENANFVTLLTRLNALFGIDRVDVFRGSYSIPSTVDISAIDPRRVELTVNGPLPRAPGTDFAFDLLTTEFRKARWTLAGPVGKEERAYLGDGKVALSESGKTLYRLTRDQLEVVDLATGQATVAALPGNFPRFSWAMDIAYDTRRKIVSVVSLGGEGFLYRFDTGQRRWLDFRSLNNIDILSLAYDQKTDRYVAWTDQGSLVFISGEGAAMFAARVLPRLEGFGRLYDRGNARAPRLLLAPNADDIALVYVRGNAVSRIWQYNVKTGNAVLTYAQMAAPSSL